MYSTSVAQWNPFVGCKHECNYCVLSFQAQLKRWAKNNCTECYDFTPHNHRERLQAKLPKTKFMQFIFTCANGDIAFCSEAHIDRIIGRMREEKDKTFLLQTKNPWVFCGHKFPDNVILGVTIETNRSETARKVSKAPDPIERYETFFSVKHPLKMITIEPVLNFDLRIMTDWVTSLNPCMVWVGYDSKACKLDEPPLSKVKELHWELARRGITVMLKTIRKAHWEE
jgi:hypothetical protein